MTVEEDARALAVLSALKDAIGRQERVVKARISDTIRRGSVGVQVGDVELGTVSIPRPSRTVRIDILDLDLVLPWLVEAYGESVVALQLTPPGRTSLDAHAKGEYERAGQPDEYLDLPGVEVSTAVGPPPSPRFTRARDLDLLAEVRGMVERGEISLARTLELESGEQ